MRSPGRGVSRHFGRKGYWARDSLYLSSLQELLPSFPWLLFSSSIPAQDKVRGATPTDHSVVPLIGLAWYADLSTTYTLSTVSWTRSPIDTDGPWGTRRLLTVSSSLQMVLRVDRSVSRTPLFSRTVVPEARRPGASTKESSTTLSSRTLSVSSCLSPQSDSRRAPWRIRSLSSPRRRT